MKKEVNTTNTISKYATVLSIVEMGLGSLLHAFHIPLSGQILSLNQGFLLSRSTLETQSRNAATTISFIAAILKSLSPAGKRLTPMLAISAQGLLFSIGTLVFGPNILGLLVGMTLLSLWAFVQPVLIYFFIYGRTFIDVVEYFMGQLQAIVPIQQTDILLALLALIAIKIVMGIAVVALAYRLSSRKMNLYVEKLKKIGVRKIRERAVSSTSSPAWQMALRDISTPLFLVSFIFTGIFFFVTQQETTQIIWGLLRPLAFAFLTFYLIRILPFEKLIKKLETTRLSSFSKAAQKSMMAIKQIELK